CLLQPLARLLGRLRHGLTFWRRQAITGFAWPSRWTADIWARNTQAVDQRLESIESDLRKQGCVPIRGSDFDRWDLEIRCGILGSARLGMAVEHHGSGRQLLRIQCRPKCSMLGVALAA